MVVVVPSVVTAVFTSRASADLAMRALAEAAGIHRDRTSLFSTGAADGSGGPRPGCRGALEIFGIASKGISKGIMAGSALFYAEILLRGDTVVHVRVDGGDMADSASDTLKRFGAIDIDAR